MKAFEAKKSTASVFFFCSFVEKTYVLIQLIILIPPLGAISRFMDFYYKTILQITFTSINISYNFVFVNNTLIIVVLNKLFVMLFKKYSNM